MSKPSEHKNVNYILLGVLGSILVGSAFYFWLPFHYYAFIVTAFPLFVGLVAHFLTIKHIIDYHKLDTLMRRKDNIIERNAEFSKKIGQGDFDSEFSIINEQDILGISLLRMRDNLKEMHQKEIDRSWIAKGKDTISDIILIFNRVDRLANEATKNIAEFVKCRHVSFYKLDLKSNVAHEVTTYAKGNQHHFDAQIDFLDKSIEAAFRQRKLHVITSIPTNHYSNLLFDFQDEKPKALVYVPLYSEDGLKGCLEIGYQKKNLKMRTHEFLIEVGELLGRAVSNLENRLTTEKLLVESQNLTKTLQHNEEKLESQIQEVEHASRRLNSLLESASEIISIYDANQKLMFISPSVEEILGFTREEMMNGKDMERLTRKGEKEFNRMFKQLLESPDQPVAIEFTYMKNDGKKISIKSNGRNFINDPAIQGIVLNSRDVTEIKRAEREERLKSKMQSLSENSLDMIIRLSATGQFYYANPVVKDYFGVAPQEMINESLSCIRESKIIYSFFVDSIKQILLKPEKLHTEIHLPINKEGVNSERIINFDAIPEFNGGELETILFIGHDVTEAKRIEIEIQKTNKKIQDSINYAERIQTSILPHDEIIKTDLADSFIFYKPKDVVSGDFPWYFKSNNIIYIAAVDCTGHGVPGALLSFVGYFLLNNIVDHQRVLSAAEICSRLHEGVRKTLKQDIPGAEARDGMDIALCKIDLNKNKIEYTGAHRPLYLIRNNELVEYKGDRKSIGGIPHRKKPEKPFTNHEIDILPKDRIFFFSDGLPDQTNEQKVKYSARRIREELIEKNDQNIQEIGKFFEDEFYLWKGNEKQIDDVLLIGIEFS